MLNEIQAAAAYIQKRIRKKPAAGVILGTGLGNRFVNEITDPVVIPYGSIPGFPVTTVASHKGQLILGQVRGTIVLVMRGRFHYYEGYSMQQVVLPVRVMKLLGVNYLLVSNAAGNLNPKWRKGELMLLDDHINLQPDSPLRGNNSELLGPRFPDMSGPYSRKLNGKLLSVARSNKIKLHTGVYVSVQGPAIETRAEYQYMRAIGADAVGMSTVPEILAARHMNMDCCAVSVLTNDCDPENLGPVDLQDVIEAAGSAEERLVSLFTELIRTLK